MTGGVKGTRKLKRRINGGREERGLRGGERESDEGLMSKRHE